MKDDEHAEKGEDEEPENFDEEVVAVDDKPGPELRRTERCGYPQLLVPGTEDSRMSALQSTMDKNQDCGCNTVHKEE